MSNIQFSTKGLGSSQNSLYEVEKFNGVDYTTTPTAVDETRAIDVSNYLPEGNGLVKRKGFRYFDDLFVNSVYSDEYKFHFYGIKKIYPYTNKITGDKFNLVFAFTGYEIDDGEQFVPGSDEPNDNLRCFVVSEAFDYVLDVVNDNSIGLDITKDGYKDLSFVEYGDNLYIFTGYGAWCVESTSDDYTPFLFREMSYVSGYDSGFNQYVPLITTNIPSISSSGKALTLEQPNLLTNLVRISLNFMGKLKITENNPDAEGATTVDFVINEFEIANYLPTKTIGELTNLKKFGGKEYTDGYGDQYNFTNHEDRVCPMVVFKADDGFTTKAPVQRTFFWNYQQRGTLAIRLLPYIIEEGGINHTNWKFLLEHTGWILQDTIEIEMVGFDNSNTINACDKALFYDDKLFVYNSESNVMYHSLTPNFPKETGTINYFGSDTYQVFGDNSSNIVATGVMNNGYMLVLKESKQGKTNIYLRHKEFRNSVVDYSIGDITYTYNKTEEIYPITQAGIDLECDKNTKIIQYDNKVIISTKKGIYYVNVESSTATQTYNAYELSYMIRNDLSEALDVNLLYVHNGLLYVFRKNKDGVVRCYVADKDRYTFIDGKMQYEWWVLDDMPVQDKDDFIYFEENKIIGNRNGMFAQLLINEDNRFYDNFHTKLDSLSLLSMVTTSATVEIDGVNENIIDYFAINLDMYDDNWTKEDYLEFKKTAEFQGHDEEWNYEWEDKVKDLYYIQYNNQNIEVARYEIEDCELIDGKWYYTGNNHFDLLGSMNYVKFRYFRPYRAVGSLEDEIPTFVNNGKYQTIYYHDMYFSKPVKAYWESKYTDLGATETLKTTSEVYFVPETRRGGAISIGYKTAKREKDFTRRKIILSRISESEKENLVNSSQFNFADVDFTDFHFETEEFAHSYSCKRKVKNFAFIQFKFYSNEPKDSTIVKFAVKYHKTRDSRGVR